MRVLCKKYGTKDNSQRFYGWIKMPTFIWDLENIISIIKINLGAYVLIVSRICSLPMPGASITCSLWFPWKRGRPTVLNCTSVGMGACKVISSRDGRWYMVRVYFSCQLMRSSGQSWETSRPTVGTRKTPTKCE